MATPALRALREGAPGVRITYGCRPYVRGLLEGLPWHDGVLLEEGGRLGFIRRLRAERFDAALILPASFGSAFEAWAAGIPRRIGYDRNARGWLLTDRLAPFREPVYMGMLYRKLAESLAGLIPDASMALATTTAQEAKAEALWRDLALEGRTVLGLVPGAAYGSAKCWPPGHFAELARLLAARPDTSVLLLYGPGEEGIAEAVRKQVGEAVRLVGPEQVGLGDLKAVMRRLAVAVTNDTGPRHIAEALGVPVVTLLGPMDRRYTDSGNPWVAVLQEPVDCHPCNLRVCPIDHRCLVRITPERVMKAVAAFLG